MAKNAPDRSSKDGPKTGREATSGRFAKSAAGSALSQKPVSKAGSITSAEAGRAVRNYLSHHPKK